MNRKSLLGVWFAHATKMPTFRDGASPLFIAQEQYTQTQLHLTCKDGRRRLLLNHFDVEAAAHMIECAADNMRLSCWKDTHGWEAAPVTPANVAAALLFLTEPHMAPFTSGAFHLSTGHRSRRHWESVAVKVIEMEAEMAAAERALQQAEG